VRQTITYEAQGALEMESLADEGEDFYSFSLSEQEPLLIDPSPVLAALVADLSAGVPPEHLAGRFHRGVAHRVAWVAARARASTGIGVGARSGGVFQNVRLLQESPRLLQAEGFEVQTHRLVPANDGGPPLAPAAVGLARVKGSDKRSGGGAG